MASHSKNFIRSINEHIQDEETISHITDTAIPSTEFTADLQDYSINQRRIPVTQNMGGFQHFSGPASSYPGKETWKKWPDVFNIYKQSMVNAGSTFDDVGRIFVAITEAAKIGVEERVILAIILNESRFAPLSL